ncbi:hypothetical protein Cflav_PD3034 [Pedosphaera parvula Ellin514]|uniref:Uncharacterized protein n=2 Tax=Pedosphaera TaxID=1032526 RepID=B9XIS5_PEDPL|nr:hypothetical protein Cflav_PD3034 [Pedosphaera parvula Ellin514]
METNWAAQNLQAIRTLMERSAIYRRALAPVMTFTGLVGVVAAVVGWYLNIESAKAFAAYWMTVSLIAVGGDYILVRGQSLKDREPFWSPPTRRVTQAMMPALFVGMMAGVICLLWVENAEIPVLLPILWMLLYGCAIHAAGFFMPRGIRLFAWGFIILGCVLLVSLRFADIQMPIKLGHAEMGLFFGVFQLAYGVYLYFTEQRKNET